MEKKIELFNPYKILREHENIELVFRRNLPCHIWSIYSRRGDEAVIFVNKHLNQAQRRCVIAHDLGHYFLYHDGCYFTEEDSSLTRLNKQENAAWKWAVDRLIDGNELKRFMRLDGQLGLYDALDRFWVPKEVMFLKLQQMMVAEGFFMPNPM